MSKNIDLITGDPKKAIVKLAWPMMVSMLLIMAYNLADSIWIAGLGSDALAALGFVTPLFMIVIGLGNGLGAGANSLIARSIGGKDKKTADNAALHSVLITFILSIVTPIILLFFLKDILILMGAGSTVGLALEYGNVIFIFIFSLLFSALLSSILRSEGDVKRAMYAMAVTAILNIVIDPIFIYTLNWGMAGAALATVFSALISCLVMAYWIWVKKDTYLSLSRSSFNYKGKIVKDILNVAIPSTAEMLIMSILAVLMNAMIMIVSGTIAVAAYTAGMRIVQLCMIPILGFGTAVLTVAGAAYGAHNYDKLKTAFTYSIKLGFVLSIGLGLIMVIFSPQIAQIFSYSDTAGGLPEAIAQVLQILSFFLVDMPFGLVSSMVFQGVGKGHMSLLITMCRSLIFEAILAYLFGFVFGGGIIGLYIGIVLGSFIGSFFGFGLAILFLKAVKKRFSNNYKKEDKK
ncbi:MATE family efflux transporter [Methanobrevibacter curvatus]|uniref:Multidrug export protein MepA n=1 Tax=Methanobrevibacter curvatus TaxID=49547 RepID=A0A166B7B0_9EURY|nr:MATE family efflux transporter [Methanobrevibacter curvatus]KZX12968.1 multidrug export protein MepA [Methanobrevibacter curvatus]